MATKELVFAQNNQALTTSLTVAEYFDKEHKNVIRDIRGLIEQIGDGLKIEPMFEETKYPDKYGREQLMYLMNRDGFTLLAMGFTGEKALKFKLDYIAAFNAMERELSNRRVTESVVQVIKPSLLVNEIGATKAAIQSVFGVKDGIAIAQATNLVGDFYKYDLSPLKALIPPAEHDTGYMNATELGAKVGKTARTVNAILQAKGLQFKDGKNWRLTEEGKHYGEEFPYDTGKHSGYQVRWNVSTVELILEELKH